MKLIGSTTSPYVRRIRLLLSDEPYEFINLDIYGEGRDELRRTNPTLKIPVLIDGDQELYDSRVIARYLGQKLGLVYSYSTESHFVDLFHAFVFI